ncbi:dipeptidase 1-like [Periplaneta americana]|uniref:dipeptidase 1-like n=1 Tax=Periplaneta americana TaxID=6978 RepID=UPI0037E97E5D
MRTSVVMLGLLLAATGYTIRKKNKGSDVLASVPLIDGHNDLPYGLRLVANNQLSNFNFSANLTQDPVWGWLHTDLPRLRAGRVGAQFWAAYIACNSQYKDAVQQVIEQVDVIKRLVAKYPEDLQFATSAQGIWDAFKRGKIASLIGVESGHALDSRMAMLRTLYELGARYVTLTHSCNTPWADSSPADDASTGVPTEHNGLSEFGKAMVLEMNRLGMAVDLAHVSHGTMVDAIQTAVAPIMFSHSSAYAVCNHHRNVRDDVLRMIPANGGIVMVNFYSTFVHCDNSTEATIEDVVRHVNHIRAVAGVDHVGIGSDFDGVKRVPVGLEDVSKFPNLFDRLADRRPGEPEWTVEDLQKLAGLNLLRVLEGIEKVRDQMAAQGIAPNEDLIPGTDLGNNTQCLSDNHSYLSYMRSYTPALCY